MAEIGQWSPAGPWPSPTTVAGGQRGDYAAGARIQHDVRHGNPQPLRRFELTRGGVMHEGLVSFALGMRGMPALAEDCTSPRHRLAKLTGGRVHILHVSTAAASNSFGGRRTTASA